MKGYGFIPEEYTKIAGQPFGKSFRFLMLLALGVALVYAAATTITLVINIPAAKAFLIRNLEETAKDFPEVEIKDGALVKPAAPYIKQKGNFTLAVIPDPVEARKMLDAGKDAFIITANEVYTKQIKTNGGAEVTIHDIRKTKYFSAIPMGSGLRINYNNSFRLEVTPERITQWAGRASFLAFPVALILIFCLQVIAKLFMLMLFSPVSMLLNAAQKGGLPYPSLLNIGTYAFVPPTALAAIADLARITLPFFPLLYMAIYFSFVFLGIKAVKETPQTTGA